MRLLAHESKGKSPGESKLSLKDFSFTFPGCEASGLAALSAGSIVASPHSGHCSFRLISPPMRFPPLAVIGGSSAGPEAQQHQAWLPRPCPQQREPGLIVNASNIRDCGSRDEARTTAGGGYHVRAEIDRNKQCPHEADLRRLRSRILTALVRGSGAAQAPASLYFTACLITNSYPAIRWQQPPPPRARPGGRRRDRGGPGRRASFLPWFAGSRSAGAGKWRAWA